VSCRPLVGIGRTGRAYASSSQPDVKVSVESAGSEQHASSPPPSRPLQPNKSVIVMIYCICTGASAFMLSLGVSLFI